MRLKFSDILWKWVEEASFLSLKSAHVSHVNTILYNMPEQFDRIGWLKHFQKFSELTDTKKKKKKEFNSFNENLKKFDRLIDTKKSLIISIRIWKRFYGLRCTLPNKLLI